MTNLGQVDLDLAGVSTDVETLYRVGIIRRKGAFARERADDMRKDMMTAFWAAIQRPRGAISRRLRRWYVEISPEEFRGFADLASHPWVGAMAQTVCGPDYEIVEIGFDTPFQGAKAQPWHRDFPSPPDTYEDRRITSPAFNPTGVDVTPDMGPFEIAAGTQWQDGRTWNHEMFPPQEIFPGFAEKGVRKFPQMGDISCWSALTVHRSTAHASPIARPVMVLGVDAPGAGHAAVHDMMVTKANYDGLPEIVRKHLVCRVVDKLELITQKHDIESLLMGAES